MIQFGRSPICPDPSKLPLVSQMAQYVDHCEHTFFAVLSEAAGVVQILVSPC